MVIGYERRVAPVSAVGNRLVGYAAKYGMPSEDLGGFRERIAPGAFDQSISESTDIRALLGHDSTLVLGRRSAGTLRLLSDEIGLRVEIDLPDTTYANDLKTLVMRGDVSQMSFGFLVRPGGDTWPGEMDNGLPLRMLTAVDLREVSVVAMPAYPDTSVALRSMPRGRNRVRDAWLVENFRKRSLGEYL